MISHVPICSIPLALALSWLLVGCEQREPFEVDQTKARAQIEQQAQTVEDDRVRQLTKTSRAVDKAQEEAERALEQNKEIQDFITDGQRADAPAD